MRADVFLVANGYVSSRQTAKRLIEQGNAMVDGRTIRKPSEEIGEGEHSVEIQDPLRYVGRGGLKLEGALDAFGIDPAGKTAADIGASTGGFTDCLLQRGATHVFAVDSGEGQLAEKLLRDARVTSMERCNARYLTWEQLGERVDLIVMDVSFISATYLLPRFHELLKPNGAAVCLVKPQFEVGRSMVGKGGVVKDRRAHRLAVERVMTAAKDAGLTPVGLIPSPIEGGDGNREFLLSLRFGDAEEREFTLDQIPKITG